MKKVLVSLALVLALVLACASFAFADTDANAKGYIVAWGEWDSVTTLDGHKVAEFLGEDYFKFVPSTCTSYGTAYYKCAEPTHLNGIHAVTIDKRDHLYVEDPDTYVAPTCTEPGYSHQVCVWCGKEGKTWEIMPNGHSFTGKTYETIVPPTCTSVGYGVVTCDVCGVRQAQPPFPVTMFATGNYTFGTKLGLYIDNAKHWVMLQKVAHSYTDWTHSIEATCYWPGEATRTCVVCGDIQYVDKDTTLWEDKNGNVKTTGDVKKGDVLLKVKAGKIDVVNEPYYKEAKKELESKTWTNRQDLEKCIAKWVKVGGHVKLASDEELDCYNRILVYVCPYCGSEDLEDDAGHVLCPTPHEPIIVTLLEPSHIFEKPERPAMKNPYNWLVDFEAKYGKAPFGQAPEKVMEQLAYTEKKSIEPSCELPGIDLYKCKLWDDATHGFDVDGGKKDGYKAVVVPAKGHKYSDWQTTETYEKDGKKYEVQVHICEVCKKTEHQTVCDGDIPVVTPPTGLEKFVERCYGQALNRMSDPAGFKYWVNLLKSKEKTAQEVAYGFVFSPEMNADRKITEEPEALLKSLYALYLGREPDPEGLEYWKQRIADGLTLEELNYGFAQSVEFQGIVASFGLK